MYDFHPHLFDELSKEEVDILRDGFLYDVDDSDYPESIKDFFTEHVEKNRVLQDKLLIAVQRLYTLSGSGDVTEDIKDIVSYPENP